MLDEQRGNEDRSSEQKIIIDVTAFSDNWLRFEKTAKLCQTAAYLTEAGYMSEGVLISVDPGELPADRTVFDITVRLPFPASASSHGILLPNISASLLGFDFYVDRMNDRVSFDSLFLRSMDKPIHVDSLRANNVRVQNWNGEITGSFTASNRIDLYAHNGAVTVNASLVAHRADIGSSRLRNAATPTLLVTTVYGAINASVNLFTRSTDEDITTGVSRTAYKTIFHTSKAPLTVIYPSAPESHNLTLFTSNSHAPTTLRLPTSFTGSLALRSQGPPHRPPHRPPIVHFDQDSDKHGRSLQVSSTSDNLVMARVLPGSSDGVQPAGGLVDVQTIEGDLDLLL
ncbi:hypothetical protein DAEQUDRAFT_764384 [Daedalea quercina L-15889]|uniref:Uncharacterized protein n=1 Tax=Daedalea quercina L-15889 TaxID=1314783 RepID=A0A165RJ20_9APHY|nr:hypothetical protein DAEQUDRAFT_764384 [Daedalea quercina L-15889]